jgi:hypothetical protein
VTDRALLSLATGRALFYWKDHENAKFQDAERDRRGCGARVRRRLRRDARSGRGQARQRVVGPARGTIAGVAWRCDGDACVGEAPRKANLDGVVRECRKVVAVIGPVASYKTGGRELTDGELKACNRAAPTCRPRRN